MVAFVHTFKNQTISAHCETTFERGRGDGCFLRYMWRPRRVGDVPDSVVEDDERDYAFLNPGTGFVT